MAKKFIIKKRVALDFWGEEWKDCFINFLPLGFEDLRAIQNLDTEGEDTEATAKEIVRILKDKFIEGTGFTDQGVVALEAADLDEFPIDFIGQAVKALAGTVSPN